jgi:hypothetical protein
MISVEIFPSRTVISAWGSVLSAGAGVVVEVIPILEFTA